MSGATYYQHLPADQREAYDKLADIMKEVGRSTGATAAALSASVAAEDGRPLERDEALWGTYAERLMMEVSDFLGRWSMPPQVICDFQDIALAACEGEYDRQMAGWGNKWGRA